MQHTLNEITFQAQYNETYFNEMYKNASVFKRKPKNKPFLANIGFGVVDSTDLILVIAIKMCGFKIYIQLISPSLAHVVYVIKI